MDLLSLYVMPPCIKGTTRQPQPLYHRNSFALKMLCGVDAAEDCGVDVPVFKNSMGRTGPLQHFYSKRFFEIKWLWFPLDAIHTSCAHRPAYTWRLYPIYFNDTFLNSMVQKVSHRTYFCWYGMWKHFNKNRVSFICLPWHGGEHHTYFLENLQAALYINLEKNKPFSISQSLLTSRNVKSW